MFKTNQNDSEYSELKFKKKKNTSLSMIVVFTTAIIFGLLVFFISNLFFGGKTNKKESTTKTNQTEISIKDNQVLDLYSYVTYGPSDERYSLFIKNKKVTQESISNLDKYLYALQFVEESDFKDESIANEEKIYVISYIKVKEYMEKFFGPNVKYASNSTIPVTLNFKVNDKNTGMFIYDKKLDAYKMNFTKKIEEDSNNILSPYYTKLSHAYKKEDNSINIVENIIYVDYQKNTDNNYTYKIYADYEHTILLDTKENVKESDLRENGTKLDDYKDATTITYTFKPNNKEGYYFYSSKIDY